MEGIIKRNVNVPRTNVFFSKGDRVSIISNTNLPSNYIYVRKHTREFYSDAIIPIDAVELIPEIKEVVE